MSNKVTGAFGDIDTGGYLDREAVQKRRIFPDGLAFFLANAARR